MERVTLQRVPTGSSFWFGNIRFEKVNNDTYKVDCEELVACKIYNIEAWVYISACALVFIN